MPRPLTEAELEALLRQQGGPYSRTSTRRGYQGQPLFSKEVIEYTDGAGVHHIELIDSPSCGNQHAIGSNGAEITGRCTVCGTLVCSAEGCSVVCAAGHTVCAAHATRVGEVFYCAKHLALRGVGKGAAGIAKVVVNPIMGTLRALLRNYGLGGD